MMQLRQSASGMIIVQETREEAARSISCALDFLRNEAYAIGMTDVGKLIDLASEKANEYWSAHDAN